MCASKSTCIHMCYLLKLQARMLSSYEYESGKSAAEKNKKHGCTIVLSLLPQQAP